MSDLILTSVSTDINDSGKIKLPDGARIRVTAALNPDNTSGWLSTGSSIIKSDNNTESWDGKTIGILSGTVPSTIRYFVEDYPLGAGDDAKSELILKFNIAIGSGSDSIVKLVIMKKDKVTVEFVDSRTDGKTYSDLSIYSGTTIPKDVVETQSGFVGWYTDPEFTNPFNHDIPVTKDITLYARYMFTVNFDYMDGTSTRLYLPQEAGAVRITSEMLPVKSREGYDFGGWYKDSNFILKWDSSNDSVSKDTILYAKWVGWDVKIEFYYTGPSGEPVKLTNGSDSEYVMATIAGKDIYPSVKVGSDFSIFVPKADRTTSDATVLVLKQAQDLVLSKASGEQKFIRWQAFSDNDPINGKATPIHPETVMTPSMVGYVGDKPVIKLFALTSNIAIKIRMVSTPNATSDLNMVFNEHYVFPDPQDFRKVGNTWVDANGIVYNEYTEGGVKYYKTEGSKVRFYSDGKGSYYCYDENVLTPFTETITWTTTETIDDEQVDVEHSETVTHYRDSYGNVWKEANNGYELVRSTVYSVDGNIEFTIESVNGQTIVWDDVNYPNGYYYKDRFGNHYERTSAGTPSVDDTYQCLSGYSNRYYSFTYVLGDAVNPGYRLVSWHGIYIPDPLYPRPGSERSIRAFVDADNYVTKVIIEATNTDGELIISEFTNIHYDPGDTAHNYKIDNPATNYTVYYQAIWQRLNYTVNVESTDNGTVDAFLIRDGKRSHILFPFTEAHYGDTIELSYTPYGNYEFNRWVTTGECLIGDEAKASTTMLVTGNCSVSAEDIGERIVRLVMIFDDNKITPSELAKTDVLMLNTETGEYHQLPLMSGMGVPTPKVYRNYVPFGIYEVCLRYHADSTPAYQEYKLLGTAIVNSKAVSEFTYYIISASIVDSLTITGATTSIVYESDVAPGSIIKYTKYAGALDTMIFRQAEERIINNPEGELPTIDVVISPGYSYVVFEGFPDTVDGEEVFVMNEEYNYHEWTTSDVQGLDNPGADSRTEKFHLNWTKYDKPAYIIAQTKSVLFTVNYKIMDGNVEKYSGSMQMGIGDTFLPAVGADMARKQIPYSSGGWYFDLGMT